MTVALPVPVLDDRSYDQLLEELTSRIPVYAPEWTDRDPSDPGMTLLELVAHLGENLLFRFNQIPDQTRLWLLRLLQVPVQPPRPARGLVAFAARAPDAPETPSVTLGSAALAGPVSFRVENDVRVLPVTTTAAIKAVAATPTDAVLDEEYRRVLDAAGLEGTGAEPYTGITLAPDPAAPGFTPLDVSTAVDKTLWVAVQAAPGVPPAGLAELLTPTGPLARDPLVLGVVTDLQYPTIDEVEASDGLDEPPESQRVRAAAAAVGPEPPGGAPRQVDSTLVWQASTRLARADGAPEYVPAAVVRDTTRGLTRDGVVGLQLPLAALPDLGVAPLDDPDLEGVGDRPPAIGGDLPILFWLRAFPRQGVPEVGRLRWVGANTAEVEQVADAVPELLGTGTGMPHQELALVHQAVVPGSLVVEVEEQETWVPWTVVDSFAASERTDRHVVLDAAAGRVRCGDSVRGRTVPIGARVRTPRYRYGGGKQGNLPPGMAWTLPGQADVVAANPVATTGGAEAETISEALDRIPGELHRRDRAVTAGDFRELASSVAGVGRAECLPRFEPTTRSWTAAGVVTVMVWPTEDPLHPDAPVPDAALLRAVCRHLDARRLVTTELYVIPPTYRKVGVSVGLVVKSGYSPIGVRRWVELVLRQYLAPLPPYGPDGRGWPLGHRVHGPELEAAVLQVQGVDFIEELKVADLSGATPVPGTVELEGWEVPELAEATVVLGTPPEPGTGGVTPAPAPAPVPVPVPKDEC
jgi:hypothetical protein